MLHKRLIIGLCFALTIWRMDAQKVVASANASHVLYLGTKNQISLAVADVSYKSLQVWVKVGHLAGENGAYSWEICETPNSFFKAYLYLAYPFADSMRQDSINFHVRPLPDPKIVCRPMPCYTPLNAANIQKITLYSIIESNAAMGELMGRCTVLRFEIVLMRKNKILKNHKNEGADFSSGALLMLKNLRDTDTVKLTKIEARCDCDAKDEYYKEITGTYHRLLPPIVLKANTIFCGFD
ncbi:GldM family protein [Haliscomenobacter hydrossis]|uniref:Uncharacterized protein n=1 Tax=Haliscomenobacter hydrossis (strain ATCC 27775 / DSM 1100 / LMG 10767 / O) TaxID=760192 RepID=F4KX46_HALH1|nr:GldM family protein [Haliscomenobacter hydrossis]AEE48274.1 hypothetical protein Halhy_0362 [Haliscomenobacter hydrossis DSM 1100]